MANMTTAQQAANKYTLPAWARGSARAVDPANSSDFGTYDAAFNTEAGPGGKNGRGFYRFDELPDGLTPMDFDRGASGGGDSEQDNGVDGAKLQAWLKANGLQMMESGEGNTVARWLQDASGNIVGKPEIGSTTDKTFGIAALLAGGVAGGAAAGLWGGVGAGAAEAAPLVATGLESAAPLITASVPQTTAVLGAGQAAGLTAGEIAAGGIGTGGTFGGAGAPSFDIPQFGGALDTGVKAMGASDWIQLAGLGAGLFQADKAQNSADAFAGQTAQQAADMLAFSKAQYADSLPFIKAAQDKSLKVADAQLASQAQQDALAKEYADYNRTTFRPLEQGIVANAQGYDTPEKRQSAADQALADVDMQFGARNAATARQLAASGVAPGSAKSMAILGSQGVEQARVGAGAAQQARKGVETTGFARQMDAASLGRNLPSAQATSAGLGIQAGNSAVGNSVAGANAGVQNAGLALNSMNAAANTNLAAGRLQQGAQDAQTQLWGQLGQTAGRYFTSDVSMKKDIEPANPEQALQQVTGTPVSNWKYSQAKMAAQGLEADGAQHTGPMAQDVNATMGESAAPGGKKIDLVTMNGRTMLAVQALDKKINMLAKMLQGGQLQAGATA